MNTTSKQPNGPDLQPPLDTNVPFMDDNSVAISDRAGTHTVRVFRDRQGVRTVDQPLRSFPASDAARDSAPPELRPPTRGSGVLMATGSRSLAAELRCSSGSSTDSREASQRPARFSEAAASVTLLIRDQPLGVWRGRGRRSSALAGSRRARGRKTSSTISRMTASGMDALATKISCRRRSTGSAAILGVI